MNIIGLLDQLSTSLDKIEVRGAENLDIMLGCMLAVKKIKSLIEKDKMTFHSDGIELVGKDSEENGRQTNN